MPTVYKLTDATGYTRKGRKNETLWQIGVPAPELAQPTKALCSNGLYHAYECPYIAAMFDCIHGDYGETARLWECETSKIIMRDTIIMCGVHEIIPINELSPSKLSINTRIHAAIVAARLCFVNNEWDKWARNWLLGLDRTCATAYATANATYDAYDTTNAANAADAAYVAANAANAPANVVAANTAYVTAYAAYATANAAREVPNCTNLLWRFTKIIIDAMQAEEINK